MLMGTWLNKRFNEQYNGCACVLSFFVHFFAILCKTITITKNLENENHNGYNSFLNFLFKFNVMYLIHFWDRSDKEKQNDLSQVLYG